MQDGFFVFPLGIFQCTSVSDGGNEYKLEAIVKNAPRAAVEEALRARGLPAETIYTPYTNLVVDTGQHRVLVDFGAGNQMSPTSGRLVDNLRSAGIQPESIDMASATNSWVMAQHFPPFPSLGRVVKTGRSWEWCPVMEKIR